MIYSIGHGNREFADFVKHLNTYKIEYLIDVRSSPYSKMFPIYNKESLSKQLHELGITYLFMGDTLGGLPKDPSCYIHYRDKKNEEVRKVDYNKIEKSDFFQTGLERLKNADAKGFNVAVMCSELHPEQCHRSKLIGVALQKSGINIQHITKNGEIMDQNDINALINGGKSPINLFGEIDLTSKRKMK